MKIITLYSRKRITKKRFKKIQEVEATIFIHTEQELIDVATKVNEGLDEYMYA